MKTAKEYTKGIVAIVTALIVLYNLIRPEVQISIDEVTLNEGAAAIVAILGAVGVITLPNQQKGA